MKLLSLELAGYRQFADRVRIEIPGGLTGVCGPNGVGKSKLVESIGFALYGPSRRVLPAGDHARDVPSRAVKGARPRVELRLELRGQVLRITRTDRTATLDVEDGTTLAETPSGVTRKVTELLRLSPDAFLGTFVAKQREVSRLLAMPASNRQRLVNRLIGISQVEAAIELAREEKSKRSQAVAVAEAVLTLSVEEAERLFTEREGALAAVTKALKEADAEREVRSGRVRAARQALEQVRSAGERLDGLRQQLEELDQHKSSLDREASAIRERVQQASAGEARLRELALIYKSIEQADKELEGFELLEASTKLRNDRQAGIKRLHELEAESTRRAEKLEVLNAVGVARTQISQTITAAQQKLVSARERLHDASQRADALTRRIEKAEELGPDGICDVCGQRYGEGFATALAHLNEEAREIRSLGNAIEQELASLKKERDDREHEAQDLETNLGQLEKEVALLEEVPGRLTVCRAELGEVDRKLANYPASGQNYDADAHARAREQANLKAEVAKEIERLRPEAESRSNVEEALVGVTTILSELEVRRSSLESAIANAEKNAVGLAESRLALEVAEKAELDAIDAVTAAAGRTSEQAALREHADRELKLAKERSEARTAARRNHLVAERTVDVLVRLLTEITEEARPRLAELMDTWGRSLLGPRFKSIDLAEDYSILADNGSGPHELSHFSGGEQTVLSVMLRVAISLFCRERAGFDTGFLILDEIFGDQDAEHRALLVEFLAEIQQHYHQVLVVNHVDDVTAMLDSIIDVTPTGPNTSTAALRM